MKKYLSVVGVLAVLEILGVLYLTHWREVFWNYVSSKNIEGFVLYIGIFTVVALILCVVQASATYFSTLAGIKWREALNTRGLALRHLTMENTNQRIQEDCNTYPSLVITIGCGLLKAVSYIIVFSVALWLNYNITYLLLISGYAIISTYVAKRIGNPLIALNYKAQQTEASYRNDLTEINFKECLLIQLSLAKKLKHLQYFQTLYGQLGVVIPILIVAPAYFTSGMLLGGMMQATSIMSTVSENLSYGITNFDTFNRLLSCRLRLKELGVLK